MKCAVTGTLNKWTRKRTNEPYSIALLPEPTIKPLDEPLPDLPVSTILLSI